VTDCHFDRIAGVYDESLPGHVVEHYLRKRSAYLRALCAGGDVLDVGCGTGTLAQRLAGEGYRVVGLDPSEGMLEVLRARAPEVEAVSGSGPELPFPDASFDLVYSVATMHHIADPDSVRRTLSEMIRVCRPGGRVVVWDHNPRNPYWPRLMARVPQDTGDERLIEAQEIVSGLRSSGGRIVRVQQLGLVPDFTPRAALWAAAGLERMFERVPYLRGLAAHNVVVAQAG
jgi:SAM-dependent methyltransferase